MLYKNNLVSMVYQLINMDNSTSSIKAGMSKNAILHINNNNNFFSGHSDPKIESNDRRGIKQVSTKEQDNQSNFSIN
ncbi:hypothetical protein ykris0001_25520 [Yersinia kristensenii ATCC 33638]|nr:hypothetical protein ykris0001_25520 [Yersinia kristensenii ATCC 33638]